MTPDPRLDDFATPIVEQEATELEAVTVEVEVIPDDSLDDLFFPTTSDHSDCEVIEVEAVTVEE